MASLASNTNSCKFGHLHWLQICPPGNTTYISKLGYQVAQLALVSKSSHQQVAPHALFPKLPYWHYQLVLICYLHQPESHQLSLNSWRTDRQTDGHPDPKKNWGKAVRLTAWVRFSLTLGILSLILDPILDNSLLLMLMLWPWSQWHQWLCTSEYTIVPWTIIIVFEWGESEFLFSISAGLYQRVWKYIRSI